MPTVDPVPVEPPSARPARSGRRAALVAAVGIGLSLTVAGGCSTGRGDGSVASRITERLQAEAGDGEVRFTSEEAACVADRVVEALGEDRLRQLGAERTSLDELDLEGGERRVVFEAVDGCVDLEGQIAGFLAGDGRLPADVARCVADRYVDSDELREAMFGAAIDPELEARIDAVLDAAVVACSGALPAP